MLRHGAASCKIKALETKTQTKPQKPLQTKTSHSHQQKGDRFMHKHPSLHKGPACNQEGEKATVKAKYKPKLPRCKDKIHTHDAHRPHIGAEPEPPTPPLCKSVPKGHQRGLQKIQEEPIFKLTTTCQPQVGNREHGEQITQITPETPDLLLHSSPPRMLHVVQQMASTTVWQRRAAASGATCTQDGVG